MSDYQAIFAIAVGTEEPVSRQCRICGARTEELGLAYCPVCAKVVGQVPYDDVCALCQEPAGKNGYCTACDQAMLANFGDDPEFQLVEPQGEAPAF